MAFWRYFHSNLSNFCLSVTNTFLLYNSPSTHFVCKQLKYNNVTIILSCFVSKEKIYNKLLEEKGFTYAITRIASPGKSEHQTGLALDFCIYKDGKCYIEHDVEDKIETKWIHQNSHRYGFILRYPKSKEDITGYKCEAWHYRYVGKKIAKYIKENNITYDEYYVMFLDD